MASLKAFFLPLRQGKRFCILREARQGATRRGSVLFVHPFAEEMNNSRRMAGLQARALADVGWVVLQIDLFGCGDSDGDFGEASWRYWLDDIIGASAWLQQETNCPPLLWGLRAGCLLCVEAAMHMASMPALILWQPVISGNQHLQQFLRTKITQQLTASTNDARIGTQQLREQLVRGENIEVAGYSLAPALALPLDAAELNAAVACARIVWLEVTSAMGGTLAPASRLCIQKMQDAGCHIDACAVEGAAFWQNPEAGDCLALIEATLVLLQAGLPEK